jgi:hypothetical protein
MAQGGGVNCGREFEKLFFFVFFVRFVAINIFF